MGSGPSIEDHSKNVTDIIGLESDSASPTDTWIVTYKNDDLKETKLFWKMFLIDSEPSHNESAIFGLEYEIEIYRDVIYPLIDNQVCPFFVKYVADFHNVSYDALAKLVNDPIELYQNRMYLHCNTTKDNIYQNGLYCNCENRSVVKNNIQDDYDLWIKLHKFPLGINQKLKSLKNQIKGEAGNEIITVLCDSVKTRPVLVNRLKKAYQNFKANDFKFSTNDRHNAYETIITRQDKDNYVLDDVYYVFDLAEKEIINFGENDITSLDDLKFFVSQLVPPISIGQYAYNKKKPKIEIHEKYIEIVDTDLIENNEVNTQLKQLRDETQAQLSYSILITESTPKNSIKFDDYLEASQDPTDEFYQIYLQLCIACYVMSLSKINHNDLHTGNVFIKTLEKPELFVFEINGNKYDILTSKQVMVYDFDRAFCQRLGTNEFLTGYPCDFGQCNTFTELLDIYKVSCYLSKYPKIEEVVFEILSSRPDNLRENYKNASSKGFCWTIEGIGTSPLNTYEDIISKVYGKIDKKSSPEKGTTYYIKRDCFESDGKLNVRKQQALVPLPDDEIELTDSEKLILEELGG